MFNIKVDKTRKESEGQYFVELTKNRELEVANCDRLGYWCDKEHLAHFQRELDKVFQVEDYTAIKTYEDACKKTGHFPVKQIKAEHNNESKYRYLISDIAYLKLATIAKALNDDPNFPTIHKEEERFCPRFVIIRDEDGNAIDIEYIGSTIYVNSCTSSNFYTKSAEIAEYFGNQFINIWRELLIGKGGEE